MKDYRENNRPNTHTIISETGHKTPHNPYDKTLLINIQCQKNQNYSYTQHIQWVKMKRKPNKKERKKKKEKDITF